MAEISQQHTPAAPADASPFAATGNGDEAADCLSPAELDADPVLAAEYARLDAVITSGPTIASYRGLSASQLHGLAVQGDSAAMAVLGAVAVMRAAALSPKTRPLPTCCTKNRASGRSLCPARSRRTC